MPLSVSRALYQQQSNYVFINSAKCALLGCYFNVITSSASSDTSWLLHNFFVPARRYFYLKNEPFNKQRRQKSISKIEKS